MVDDESGWVPPDLRENICLIETVENGTLEADGVDELVSVAEGGDDWVFVEPDGTVWESDEQGNWKRMSER